MFGLGLWVTRKLNTMLQSFLFAQDDNVLVFQNNQIIQFRG